MTPDPALVYMTAAHREALAGLRYAVLAEKGFTLLTGDAGTGKTTMVLRLLASLPPQVKVCRILNPVLEPAEFLEALIIQLGVQDMPSSKTRRLLILRDLLFQADACGELPVLIVDEAHKLDVDLLEEIRLLGNLETAEKKLLQIILAGQTEMCDLLNREDLWQLKQRFAVRLHINALSQAQTAEYIAYRWRHCGGTNPAPFSPAAMAAIARHAKGIPRIINAICDNALVLMMAQESPAVDEATILTVCKDLDLWETRTPPAAARPGPRIEAPVPVAAPPDPVPVNPNSPGASPPGAVPFQTLHRYEEASVKKSLLSRCAARLGLVD
jgi:general secretion pathway protein A